MVIMPQGQSSDTAGEDTDFYDDLSMENDFCIGASGKGMSPKKGRPSVRKKRSYRRKNFPKKALTAYNIFFRETREKILTEHGKTNFQEMVRKIAALWKEVTPEDKLRFDAIATRDLARYKEEVSEYELNIVEKSQKKLNAKEENRPMIYDLMHSGVNARNHRDQDSDVLPFPVKTVHISNGSFNRMAAGVGQGLPDKSNVLHTLTSNELKLAQNRLVRDRLVREVNSAEDLQSVQNQLIGMSRLDTQGKSLSTTALHANVLGGIDLAKSKMTPAEKQFYYRGLSELMPFRGDKNVQSGEALVGNRIALDIHRVEGEMNNGAEMKNRMVQGNLNGVAIASNSVEIMKRLGLGRDTLATAGRNSVAVANGVESREKFAFGIDPTAALTDTRLKKHPYDSGKGRMIALNDEELRNLALEAEMKFGRSGTRASGANRASLFASNENEIRRLLGSGRDSTPAFDEKEIQDRLSLQNLARSNVTEIRNHLILNDLNRSFQRASSEDEIIKRMRSGGDPMASSTQSEVGKRLLMDGLQPQLVASKADLQMRLAMMENRKLFQEPVGNSPQTAGMGNILEEIRLREGPAWQRERLMNQAGNGTASSVHTRLSRAELSSVLESATRMPFRDTEHTPKRLP